MKSSNTSERLKLIMRERNLKQVDIVNKCQYFANRLGIAIRKNDISQWVAGKYEPSQTRLTALGLALNVSEAWLMGYDVPRERDWKDAYYFDNVKLVERQRLPMLGEIACGQPIFTNEDRESYVISGTNIQADFCLTCRGDSMINARIFDGDIVFIRKQDMVENGEIAAVIIDDSATLKRVFYYSDQNRLVLQAENARYAPMVFTGEELNNIHILGKAIAFQSDVR